LAVGGWRLAVGGWRLAVGGWRLAVGGWRLAVESIKPKLLLLILSPLGASPPLWA
jgi:hypothetical protein